MSEYLVDRLKLRHRELEDRISEELSATIPNTYVVKTLKKQKLAIRDKLLFMGTGTLMPSRLNSAGA